jgi:hypothetical protein
MVLLTAASSCNRRDTTLDSRTYNHLLHWAPISGSSRMGIRNSYATLRRRARMRS